MNTLKEKMDLLLDFVRRQLKQEISIWNQLNVTGGRFYSLL